MLSRRVLYEITQIHPQPLRIAFQRLHPRTPLPLSVGPDSADLDARLSGYFLSRHPFCSFFDFLHGYILCESQRLCQRNMLYKFYTGEVY